MAFNFFNCAFNFKMSERVQNERGRRVNNRATPERSFRHEDVNDWLRQMLRDLATRQDLDNVVVVIDNAPSHSRAERVFEEDEFRNATLLRLSPYSAPLNPIELYWSNVKEAAKAMLNRPIPAQPVGITQVEHRLQFLENVIDRAIDETRQRGFQQYFNHVFRYYNGCIQMQDLPVGI